MSLNTTTLTSACLITDTSIVVASATGIAAESIGRIDDETVRVAKGYVAASLTVPLIRGQQGTLVSAHPVTANFTVGAGSDAEWGTTGASASVPTPLAGRTRRQVSYSASGAIAMPDPGTDQTAVLNFTSALAMTIANPSKALDGVILTIISNGKGAHTIDFDDTVGLSGAGASYDTITFQTGGQEAFQVMAMNGAWVLIGAPITGTVTSLAIAIA